MNVPTSPYFVETAQDALSMKTSPVTFCSSSVEQIIDHHTKTTLMESIRQCVNINIAERTFRPVKNIKDLMYLQNPHLITVATRCQRWLMYLTQVNHKNVCVLIERSIKPGYPYPKMLVVPYHFNEILYQNTLMDLEVIDNAKGHDTPLILVCDILMMKNRDVSVWDPVRRMNTLHIIFGKQFTDNMQLQPSAIQIKRLFCINNFDDLIVFLRTLPYEVKGLHFLPLNSKYPKRTWWDTHKQLYGNTLPVEQPPPPQLQPPQLTSHASSPVQGFNVYTEST